MASMERTTERIVDGHRVRHHEYPGGGHWDCDCDAFRASPKMRWSWCWHIEYVAMHEAYWRPETREAVRRWRERQEKVLPFRRP
jgi:hypothetical protein